MARIIRASRPSASFLRPWDTGRFAGRRARVTPPNRELGSWLEGCSASPHAARLFTRDGWVYEGLPPRAASPAVWLARHPKRVGVYRIAGRKLVVRWGGIEEEQTLDYDPQTRTVKVRGVKLSHEPQVRGALDGTYEVASTSGGSDTRLSASFVKTLTFRADGRFERRDQSAISGTAVDVAPKDAVVRGSYRLDRYVLELQVDGKGAETRRHWVCSSEPGRYLFLDGELWLRKDGR